MMIIKSSLMLVFYGYFSGGWYGSGLTVIVLLARCFCSLIRYLIVNGTCIGLTVNMGDQIGVVFW